MDNRAHCGKKVDPYCYGKEQEEKEGPILNAV
jgi:hypothetical protein